MGSSSSRSASFSCPHGSRRRSNDSATSSPYDSIEDQRTLYCAADRDPPRWRRRKKHFLSANKSLAGRIAKHRKPVASAAAAAVAGAKGKSPVLASSKSSSSSKEFRRRKSTRKRNGCRARASDSGRGSDECDCGDGDGGGMSSDEAAATESLASCPYCNEEEEEEFGNLDGEKEFVKSSLLRIEANEISYSPFVL